MFGTKGADKEVIIIHLKFLHLLYVIMLRVSWELLNTRLIIILPAKKDNYSILRLVTPIMTCTLSVHFPCENYDHRKWMTTKMLVC
jgi:hypothetical protein